MQTRTNTLTKATIAAALAGAANAHITMKEPAPFGSISKVLTTSPLTSSQFPCQVTSDPATFYSTEGLNNSIAIGQPQTLSFSGSAVHGGGSCQLALTKDKQPTASTSWQVILSMEGGCPSKSGTGTDEYQYTVPDDFAAGDYVLAWTWISKLSGVQEYYMNCAPITLTGGSGKKRAAGSYPELMVSNLADINSCKSVLSSDPTYPNPGSNVLKPGTNNAFKPITGSNCVPKGLTDSSGSSSGSSGSDSGSASSSAAAPPASSSAAAPPASSSGFVTTTVPAQPTSSAPAASSSAPATPASSAPASGSSSVPSTGGLSGSCTSEGMFNCIDGTSYQQCASGTWTAMQAMPATTKCQVGQTMTLWARSWERENNGASSFSERRRSLY